MPNQKRKVPDRNTIVFGPFKLDNKGIEREIDYLLANTVPSFEETAVSVSEPEVIFNFTEPPPADPALDPRCGIVVSYDSTNDKADITVIDVLFENVTNMSGFTLRENDRVGLVFINAATPIIVSRSQDGKWTITELVFYG